MRRTGLVVRVVDMRSVYKSLVEKPIGRRELGRLRYRRIMLIRVLKKWDTSECPVFFGIRLCPTRG